ncbi:DAK2 domain-containing protein [Bombilactobacillus thymidiniphilus]|uniref:DAK2 domain-containing protein n=1 Tax=Bombilactobacillus thymidiniphilus TaxID=2923363 RepID=A0ABY4PD95_9LACO|nr:DAK2 domain-containing protein [Bombilactobacillus thymidiniphilus]UQS83466.1 DAK2 domain-containing protein [Bombilactobacillus thymidiniphilus]
MSVKKITANEFKDMIRIGSHRLDQNAKFVDSLNVFPVPDGDTGTNMNLTFQSGYKAVNEADYEHVGELAKALSKGLLMGARGNSGVITSQIFRGFGKSLEQKSQLTATDLSEALVGGVQTAYQAVMKPVEGTILTVARGASEAAQVVAQQDADVLSVMQAAVAGAKKALAKTPDLLPVLKEVGVVDSGGQGLLFVYEGFLQALGGQVSDAEVYQPNESEMDDMLNAAHHQSAQAQFEVSDIHNGFCTEMMVQLGVDPTTSDTFQYEEFRNYLANIGDSLLVVADDEVVKVHVHTQHPQQVFAYGKRFGNLSKIKIDNMRIQHETIVENDDDSVPTRQPVKELDYAIIAVVSGAGLEKLFTSLGVTTIISGGQTMNPSTQDIVDAINNSHAQRVLVLPNNGNIVMAAQQAQEVVDIPTQIVPSKSIAQGMTALLSFDQTADLMTNQENMTEALPDVKSGQITQAVRDSVISDLHVKENDVIGIVDGEIVVNGSDAVQVSIAMVQKMVDGDSEVVTIIIGQTGEQAIAEQIAADIETAFDDLEVEIHQGDQPVYPYLIAVE